MVPSTARHRRRSVRALAAGFGVTLLLSGCGFDAQTLQEYTPAHGVNVDDGFLKVRNLLIIANDQGQGQMSASIVSQRGADTLTGVSGYAIKSDGSRGSALTVGRAAVPLRPGEMVVLTHQDAPTITVSGADLKPGLTANLTLTFASGAVETAVVPVVDAKDPIYASVVPSTAAGSASPSPSPSATPTR